jgi:hypothetical protein
LCEIDATPQTWESKRTAEGTTPPAYADAACSGGGARPPMPAKECLRVAGRAGHDEASLWTNDVLTDARRMSERGGFSVVEEHAHRSFGRDLVDQTWVRLLSAPGA